MANYYIDYTNGNDARTGLRIPVTSTNTVDSTADTTHFVDAALTGADDYINGSFFWNATVGAGSLITDFVAGTDTVTLGSAIVGMATGDTYYILDSWKTIGKYTTTTSRTAGDIAYLRANMTHLQGAANIEFDENGTQAAPISIIGCVATVNDPWVDASNTLPIVSFADGAYQLVPDCNYWIFKRLNIRDTTKTGGLINLQGTGCQLSYCDLTDSGNAAGMGIYLAVAGTMNFIDNCTFNNNKIKNIAAANPVIVFVDSCTFNGGAETTDYGIYASAGALVYVSNSTFGSTSAHDLSDITALTNSKVYSRNCTFNKTALVVTNLGDEIHSEDDDGTFGNQVSYYYTGTVTKLTAAGSIRSGGATSSAQMMPTSQCGAIHPLCINNQCPIVPDFAIYNTSTSPLNVDIYIRGDSAWGTYPTNTQLYTEASYLSNAASAARTTVVSTDVLSDGTTWVRFRTTMTPARAGFIYIKVYLKLYADGEGILVDIKPVIS